MLLKRSAVAARVCLVFVALEDDFPVPLVELRRSRSGEYLYQAPEGAHDSSSSSGDGPVIAVLLAARPRGHTRAWCTWRTRAPPVDLDVLNWAPSFLPWARRHEAK